ncbi:MAG: carboxypeptidase-like regulatory domain-containing protein [Bacteroidota bacterium]
MKTKLTLFLTLFFTCFSLLSGQITGKVVDQQSNPIAGVNIILKGTSTSTSTDFNGNFSLTTTVGIKGTDAEPDIYYDGNAIYFSSQVQSPVISIYEINGRLVKTIAPSNLQPGSYKFYPSAHLPEQEFGIYIVSVNTTTRLRSFKIIANENRETNREIMLLDSRSSESGSIPTVFKSTGEAMEPEYIGTIQFSYTGFSPKEVGFSSNPENLGNVVMVASGSAITNFAGGTLDDLRALNQSLTFGTLNINGELTIPSSVSSVVLTVDNLNVNGKIKVAHPSCSPFYNSPDMTINATGVVTVNSSIDLSGTSGDNVASTATCLSCYGKSGGSMAINAREIYMNSGCNTRGGTGMGETYSNPYYICGCDGGNGGDITYNAIDILETLSITDYHGGGGGSSTSECSDGDDGIDGVVTFAGSSIKTSEVWGDLNMFDYNAQILPYNNNMTLTGTVKKDEEINHRGEHGAWNITYDNGSIDWLEDLYLVDLQSPGGGQLKVSLSPVNPNADLDLFIISENFSVIYGQSNGATGEESITTGLLTKGKYFVAVSFADDDPDNITTDYTLTFGQ